MLSTCRSDKRNQPEPTTSKQAASITIDYPIEGSLFPPEFPSPTWAWRDTGSSATYWEISISFSDSSPPIWVESAGARMQIGDIDPRAVATSNSPPTLTPEQAAAHTWTPDSSVWSTIKKHSVTHAATVVITGRIKSDPATVISQGQSSIQTSTDSVGAPIFYRDVPLMPSENEKGVIKPLAPHAMPLIAWRLRSIGNKKSSVVMEGLHTCANCHSFSADGTTLGMDMDGPLNDKGLYGIVKVQPHMVIRNEDLVAWSTFRGKLGSKLRVGFMSQIAPDGRHVITSVNDPGIDQSDYERRKSPKDLVNNYYVANFKDYRFLQVFYPTRGILAWYDKVSGHLRYLPGADDSMYVHANAVWTPDGKYLVFIRAKAREAYPAGAPKAQYAGDTNETPIRYDLYRIPFNNGKGGKAEPIAGASDNGMSNSFPKVSPDGKWIVFVKCHNGMLMRPDGELYIVPATGGAVRRMKCNTLLMNSWHSFSPNGRWMVFSSKSRTPYTQMFLTHISESGDDSPPILIENATAANRAVNLPEFVNIPPDGMQKIEAPVAEYGRHTDLAVAAMKNQAYETAVQEWKKALEYAPQESWVHSSLGVALMETGNTDDAIKHYRKAIALNPHYVEAFNNLGEALSSKGLDKEAIINFERALELNPEFTVARANLGMIFIRTGEMDKVIFHLKKVIVKEPDVADTRRNLGHALAEKGQFKEASIELAEAVRLSDAQDPLALYLLGRVYNDLGRLRDAADLERTALAVALQQNNIELAKAIQANLLRRPKTRQTTAP